MIARLARAANIWRPKLADMIEDFLEQLIAA